jgi:hypothetical protein
MSKPATTEYIERTRERYRAMTTRLAKGRVLDDFCETTNYDRKHAIKLLNGRVGCRTQPPGRKRTYDEGVKEPLKEIWMMSDQMCSKLLKAIMPVYVRSYEKRHGALSRNIRRKLWSISPASMDRLLSSEKVDTAKWRRRPNAGTCIKKTVPIRCEAWDVSAPGWFEVDGVAHCGGSMRGNFVWSLTYTDIHTAWTENRAIWNRGAEQVKEQTIRVEEVLPFVLRGVDVDNGPEFLNWTMFRYLKNRDSPVEFTRSRPYHKNDNAHVEQKNSTHVRQLLGHDRFEDPAMVEMINDLYANEWSLYRNLFCPNMKLIEKVRVGSRYRKKFDKPRTAAQRVLESPSVSRKQKARIRRMLKEHDPFTLRENIEKKLQEIFTYEQQPLQLRAS